MRSASFPRVRPSQRHPVAGEEQICNRNSGHQGRRTPSILLALGAGLSNLAIALLAAPSAEAQTETILHSFTTVAGGQGPQGSLLMDASGNLYGTTPNGGNSTRDGVVYELVNSSGTYTENVLYDFGSVPNDGVGPNGGLITDASGNLYGTTLSDSEPSNRTGTVFELVNSSGTYTEKVLYRFGSIAGDGSYPYAGVIMDTSGNLYGTTSSGGANGCGTVFELVNSSGTYSEKVLHNFAARTSGTDGCDPQAGLIMDASGNLYGTTIDGSGPNGYGTVFELVNSSGTYSESVLYAFTDVGTDGAYPNGGVILDASGNLYGTTEESPPTGSEGGVVFELVNSGGTYTENTLHSFGSFTGDGEMPTAGLIMDVQGNIYGTTYGGGDSGGGVVFELAKSSGAYNILHTFGTSAGDGLNPDGGLIVDPSGNLYGTTINGGGTGEYGTVFEISPGACTSYPNPNPNPNPVSFDAVGDFNGDCKSDILWQNISTGLVYTWLMNGTSILSQAAAETVPPTSAWVIQGVGDFNGDGKADILWQNSTTGEVYLWFMNGSTIASQAEVGVVSPSSGWVIVGVGDFNGDGKADILWQNTISGEVYIWFMNGSTIASQAAVGIVPSSTGWVIKGVGDFNGDGMADILWQNTNSGEVYLWLMNGSTIISQAGVESVPSSSGWVIQGVGDFNGDGTSDILWRNSNSGEVYIWLMNGTTIAGQASPETVAPSSGWVIQGVGDYDGSGRAGILWRNSSSGEVYMWLMNEAAIESQAEVETIAPSADWQIFPLLSP